MRKDGKIWRPDLSSVAARKALPVRPTPYYLLLSYDRHLGIWRTPGRDFWTARLRTRAGGYRRRMLGEAVEPSEADGVAKLSHDQALEKACRWFEEPKVREFAARERPIGTRRTLVVSPIGAEFSIAHAMFDYAEWKRLAAAKSHFETNLSLINHHIVPRLGNVAVSAFTGEVLRDFVRDVLETSAKRGNQEFGRRVAISSLDEDALRRRKKTVNTLIGILRVAFQMAWENGKLDDERAWLFFGVQV